MAQIRHLQPAIDAPPEIAAFVFDYGPQLRLNIITLVQQINMYVISGYDPTPQARLIGNPQVMASPITGDPETAVRQNIGGMLDGVRYGMQCIVQSVSGEHLCSDRVLPARKPFPGPVYTQA